jgi:hypothetical protein
MRRYRLRSAFAGMFRVSGTLTGGSFFTSHWGTVALAVLMLVPITFGSF